VGIKGVGSFCVAILVELARKSGAKKIAIAAGDSVRPLMLAMGSIITS